MFKTSQYIDELRVNNPTILEACEKAMSGTQTDLDFVRVDKEAFEACPSDYAIMKFVCSADGSGNLIVDPMNAGLSDVGSWSALLYVSEKDCNNNVHKGDVIAVRSTNNYVFSENKLIATVRVDNLVIVETKDAILVAEKSQVQNVKAIVNVLKDTGRSEYKIPSEMIEVQT